MPERKRDGVATTIGLFTFLGGVGLIVATFWLAQTMFSVEPGDAIGIEAGKPLDLNNVVAAGVWILMRVILLVVMAGIGSAVATRGIKLYTHSSDAAKKD